MPEFNLIDEPWIPCFDLQGNQGEYGIRDALLKAHELREICDDSPLVTVAIHRLLLAILYRAFNGPKDFTTWNGLFSFRAFNQETISAYLSKCKKGFDLFEKARPFYQMANFETKDQISVNRLATECASGNNATLFDHCGDQAEVRWSPVQATKYLIACQAFALGFGKSSKAKINGTEEKVPYSADAIALRGMTLWLQGSDLFKTLAINLVPIEDNSLPPWELENSNMYRDTLQGKTKRRITALGVIDRFTWQSRLIRLVYNNDGTVSRMYYTQGRSADKSPGDPMKVYRTYREEGTLPVPLSSEKAVWRDVHVIFSLSAPNTKDHQAEIFNHLARTHSSKIIDAIEPFMVQIVGIASAPKKAGKFLLWRHERMPVPLPVLRNMDMIERIGGLIQNAENAASELGHRIWEIAVSYLKSAGGQQPDKKKVKKLIEAIDPRLAYWARLEQHFFTLLESLPSDWNQINNQWKPDDQQTATNKWCKAVKDEATRALEESICSLGTTARAIQAVARVRTDFNDLDPLLWKAAKVKKKGGKRKK